MKFRCMLNRQLDNLIRLTLFVLISGQQHTSELSSTILEHRRCFIYSGAFADSTTKQKQCTVDEPYCLRIESIYGKSSGRCATTDGCELAGGVDQCRVIGIRKRCCCATDWCNADERKHSPRLACFVYADQRDSEYALAKQTCDDIDEDAACWWANYPSGRHSGGCTNAQLCTDIWGTHHELAMTDDSGGRHQCRIFDGVTYCCCDTAACNNWWTREYREMLQRSGYLTPKRTTTRRRTTTAITTRHPAIAAAIRRRKVTTTTMMTVSPEEEETAIEYIDEKLR